MLHPYSLLRMFHSYLIQELVAGELKCGNEFAAGDEVITWEAVSVREICDNKGT